MTSNELNSIAFIPDGNRRFSKTQGLNLISAYEMGTQKALQVVEWLMPFEEIKFGTFYTLSQENLNRSKPELKILFEIFKQKLLEIKKPNNFFNEHNVRVKFIGKLELLPKSVQSLMHEAENITEKNDAKTINLAIAYNGQQEIVDACKKISLAHENNNFDLNSLNTENFSDYLYNSFSFPDLIVRTSGEERLSGFLTYQSAYSELYFIDKFWPEITKNDVNKAISTFYGRHRKFGK